MSENSSELMEKSYLITIAALLMLLPAWANDESGCTLSQWDADSEFTLSGGEVSQMFIPCQNGVLEYISLSTQRTSEEAFSVRMKLYEMINGSLELIHQQQGPVSHMEQNNRTTFSFARNVKVSAEREYFVEIDIPENRELAFQYSQADAYDEGEMLVNHAQFRGDLAFEVGINPFAYYNIADRVTSPELERWNMAVETPAHACSVGQTKYNGSELLSESAFSQTFDACYTGGLNAIWFQGEVLASETGVPVYVFERETGDFVGASEIKKHPLQAQTLTANFDNVEVKAGRKYELFIDCSESQQLEMQVVRNRSFFVGDFRKGHEIMPSNLSFVVYLEDDNTSSVDSAWSYDDDTAEPSIALDVRQSASATGIEVELLENVEGQIILGLYNILGHKVEEKILINAIAGETVFFSTAGDQDQEYYSVRVVQAGEMVVDTTYRR